MAAKGQVGDPVPGGEEPVPGGEAQQGSLGVRD